MGRIYNTEWSIPSLFEYDTQDELTPLDDDYIPEEYSDEEDW